MTRTMITRTMMTRARKMRTTSRSRRRSRSRSKSISRILNLSESWAEKIKKIWRLLQPWHKQQIISDTNARDFSLVYIIYILTDEYVAHQTFPSTVNNYSPTASVADPNPVGSGTLSLLLIRNYYDGSLSSKKVKERIYKTVNSELVLLLYST